MRIIASMWRVYRRRRPRTQVVIAALVLVVAIGAAGEEAPATRTDLVIEERDGSHPSLPSTTTTSMAPIRPQTAESTAPPTSSTSVRIAGNGGADAAAASGDLRTVTKHVDGDTLWVSGGEKVRFIGMDTPESTNGRRDCFGAEASARTAELLPLGTEVRLVSDAGRRDRYGRTLAYVYRASDGLFVNAALVRDGYAQVMTVPPNVAHVDEFVALQREAREAGRGFWGACGSSSGAPASVPATTAPQVTTTAVPVRPLAGGGCHPSYRGTCIPPDVSDVDCAGGKGDGPHYVQEKDIQVVGSDPYRLDSDGDGVGCES